MLQPIESIPIAMTIILVLGMVAQWVSWRIGLPSILLLLVFGISAGPLTGLLDPDTLFGATLMPCVSLAVALILYEGGLTLRTSEFSQVGRVVRNLITIGTGITWAVGTLAALWILELSFGMAALLAAVVVVTGPTVITPLLRHIRPSGPAGSILKWEGIVIDPIGALLAVLVFEIVAGHVSGVSQHLVEGLLRMIIGGGLLGCVAAALLVISLRRHLIPDHLENAASLTLVLTIFVLANMLQHEAGLLAVTVMGFVLANQKSVDVKPIVEFKEHLRVLLISSLFIVLAAQLELGSIRQVAWRGAAFAGVLIFVARPLAVMASTIGAGLHIRERLFIAWMAPRGIVAAAVSTVFAMRLGGANAEALVSYTFITIIITVTVYALTAPTVARILGVTDSKPQGILFVGAHSWVRDMAEVLQREGFAVLLVDSNRENISRARMAGLPAWAGSILADQAVEELNLGGIGRLCAVTSNDSVNMLAVQRFKTLFGKANCYQIPPTDPPHKGLDLSLQGRALFDGAVHHTELSQRAAEGYRTKATKLSEAFDLQAFTDQYGTDHVPLFYIDEHNNLVVLSGDHAQIPETGCTLVSLFKGHDKE